MIIGETTTCGKPISLLKRYSDFRVKVICDTCSKEYDIKWSDYQTQQIRKEFSGIVTCRSCAVKESHKNNPRIRKKRGPNPKIQGPNSIFWKGGERIDASGYKWIYIGAKNKTRTYSWERYRKEHQLVMEEFLQRPLIKGEIIHHIDGNKCNNTLENLVLCPNNQYHSLIHCSLEIVAMEYVRAGWISYDKDTNRYMAHNKLRELLETPPEDNQQPSLESNLSEGSETRDESFKDNNFSTSAGHS